MFWNNTIRKGVMKVIDEQIAEAEKEYRDGCNLIMDEATIALDQLHEKIKADKASLSSRLIKTLLAKVI